MSVLAVNARRVPRDINADDRERPDGAAAAMELWLHKLLAMKVNVRSVHGVSFI